MLLPLFYLISSLSCFLHFHLEHNVWPDTISASIMREDTDGNINRGGLIRYTFYMTINIIISIIIISNELYLLRYYKRKLKLVFDNKIIMGPYMTFIISVILGTIIGGQNYHSGVTDCGAMGCHDAEINGVRSHLGNTFAYISNYSLAVVALTVLLRTLIRSLVPTDKIRVSTALFLLPTTTILTLASILLFIYTDVPRQYGLHISLTVMAVVSAIVFLDVRGIKYSHSIISLLFVYLCFTIQITTSTKYNGFIEIAAFTGFFIGYSFHNRYIREP